MSTSLVIAEHAGFLMHVVPDTLVASWAIEVQERRGTNIDKVVFSSPNVYLDLPGMVLATRHLKIFELGDGDKLTIPSEDVLHFYHQLKWIAKERVFSTGLQYYKVHGWRFCVIFTPEQREDILRQMELILDEAIKEGKEDTELFSQATKALVEKGFLYRPKPKDKADA